jgi:hypothetical protein
VWLLSPEASGLSAERRQSCLAFMIVRSGPPARRVRGQRLAACPQRTQVDGGRLNRTGVRAKATAGVAVRDHGALLKRSKVRPKLFVYEVLADSGTKAIKISEQSYSRKPHAVACGLNPWLPSRFNANTSRKLFPLIHQSTSRATPMRGLTVRTLC